MENTARPLITRFDSLSLDAVKALMKRRWRRILLECLVLAAFVINTSLIARG